MMLKTFEGDVSIARRAILEALQGDATRPEVFVAAVADIIGYVAADLTVRGQDGTKTLDERMDSFIDRARTAYRRHITSLTIGPKIAELNGLQR